MSCSLRMVILENILAYKSLMTGTLKLNQQKFLTI